MQEQLSGLCQRDHLLDVGWMNAAAARGAARQPGGAAKKGPRPGQKRWCMNMNQLLGARAGHSLTSNEQEVESRGYKVGGQAAVQQRAAPCHLHS